MWKYLDLNANYSRGTLGYDSSVTGFKSDFSAVSLNLKLSLIGPEYYVRPFVFAGVGAILFDRQLNFHKELIDSALPTAGGGINFRLSPVVSLNLQETFMFTNNDSRDGVVSGKKDDYLMQFVRQFTYANQGKAFYTGLKGLGEMIFEDYETNRKKKIK